ncbi:radical SAM protein [Azospirillum agricola]|uniref:radical SAM protein n=1 Tax=Azospirillum agricola TaxID=1720247 RepID=UPI000A0F401C|nr:radical SAM protein [Azospirillum agricola]SMH41865.1 radical SAM additional 4Fe4S-binding SPASM domain-containing protein [Azospirillum lipoferum]
MNPFQARAVPSWIVFQLLERCNLRCAMCYEWGEAGAYHERAELAELDPSLVLRTVRECLPAKPYFEFFGGEPLLYRGIWDVIALIREGGCELAFPTNGTLVERHAERLVRTAPTGLWLSVDGPQAINDQQRGKGVFRQAMNGFAALERAKRAAGSRFPELGITYVVTPLNHRHIADFFLDGIDLSRLAFVSIELQSYATTAEHQDYAAVAERVFGVTATPCAKAYVRDPAVFAGMDVEAVVEQMTRVRDACARHGVRFHSQPRTLEVGNLTHYLSAEWDRMADRRSRCGFPWAYAEISARGEVTTCHSFYDLSIGNLNEQPLAEIWQGEKAKRMRAHLRETLFPICTACCRYHTHSTAPGR